MALIANGSRNHTGLDSVLRGIIFTLREIFQYLQIMDILPNPLFLFYWIRFLDSPTGQGLLLS